MLSNYSSTSHLSSLTAIYTFFFGSNHLMTYPYAPFPKKSWLFSNFASTVHGKKYVFANKLGFFLKNSRLSFSDLEK